MLPILTRAPFCQFAISEFVNLENYDLGSPQAKLPPTRLDSGFQTVGPPDLRFG